MAAENFKVKRGLEVGTGTTITSGGVDITGIITAVQFKGDGSGLTGVVGSGSGVVIKDEGSTVGTAGTINFVGSDVSAAISEGTATVTVGVSTANVVTDSLVVTGVSTFSGNSSFAGGNVTMNTSGSPILNASGTSRFEIASMENAELDGSISHTGDTTTQIQFETSTIKLDTAGTTRLKINNSGVTVTGVSTFAGITTVTGNTLFTKQLNVSGVSTFAGITTVTGNTLFTKQLNVSGIATVQSNLHLPDASKLMMGDNNEFRIYHNESNSLNYIVAQNNGPLLLRSSNADMIHCSPQGAVTLKHDGSTKIQTTNHGAVVTGVLTATSFSGLHVGNVQGNVTGNASGSSGSCTGNAATATEATNVTVTANNSTDETVYPVFVDGATGTQGAETDTGLIYNPSTGQLNATKFVGDGSGLTNLPGGGSYGNNDVDTHLNTSTASNGEVLSWNGSDYDWVAQSGGSGISTANVVTDTLNVSGVSTFGSSGQVVINDIGRVTCSAITISDGQPGLVFEDTNADPDFILQNRNGSFAIRDITSSPGVNRFFVNASNGDVTVTGNIVGDNSTNISGIASVTATSFHGSGIGLTSLDADNLGSGVIPNGRFPATLPAVSGANLTNLPAANLTGTLPAISGENLTGIAGFSPDAQGNLVAGTNAGANFSGTDANNNVLIGYEAGNAITTADNNVAIGYEALKSVDTESGNTAVGYRALKELTGMGYNVAVGYQAGYYTYSLYYSVAVGYNAMSKPVQSGYNTWYSVAVGANAMQACGGDRCVAIGYEALEGNNAATADDNTAIGHQSLMSLLQSGLKNTAVGSLSGKATTSGEENVYIGYNAGNNAHTTGNNCIIIGNNAAATSSGISSEITLGDTNINKFRVPGIGVTFTSTTADSFSSDGQFVTSRWTVANNGSSNYTFTGPGGLSAASNSTLYLARGQTYEFNMNASGHGFGIQTSSGGWNASNEYTTGITNAKAAVGVIKFEVPFSAPNTLYYACTAGHGGMVGSLVIYPSI